MFHPWGTREDAEVAVSSEILTVNVLMPSVSSLTPRQSTSNFVPVVSIKVRENSVGV